MSRGTKTRHCRWCGFSLRTPGNRVAYPSNNGCYGAVRCWLCEECMSALEAVFDAVPVATVKALVATHQKLAAAAR